MVPDIDMNAYVCIDTPVDIVLYGAGYRYMYIRDIFICIDDLQSLYE